MENHTGPTILGPSLFSAQDQIKNIFHYVSCPITTIHVSDTYFQLPPRFDRETYLPSFWFSELISLSLSRSLDSSSPKRTKEERKKNPLFFLSLSGFFFPFLFLFFHYDSIETVDCSASPGLDPSARASALLLGGSPIRDPIGPQQMHRRGHQEQFHDGRQVQRYQPQRRPSDAGDAQGHRPGTSLSLILLKIWPFIFLGWELGWSWLNWIGFELGLNFGIYIGDFALRE